MKRRVVNVNIEQEYNKHIRRSWQRLSHLTVDALRFYQKQGRVSNHEEMSKAISQWSMRFLQDKLRRLELEGD
jgi:hypothetical protein